MTMGYCKSLGIKTQNGNYNLPKNSKKDMNSPEGHLWKAATEAEIASHEKNNTWKFVKLPPRRKCIPSE